MRVADTARWSHSACWRDEARADLPRPVRGASGRCGRRFVSGTPAGRGLLWLRSLESGKNALPILKKRRKAGRRRTLPPIQP